MAGRFESNVAARLYKTKSMEIFKADKVQIQSKIFGFNKPSKKTEISPIEVKKNMNKRMSI